MCSEGGRPSCRPLRVCSERARAWVPAGHGACVLVTGAGWVLGRSSGPSRANRASPLSPRMLSVSLCLPAAGR